MNARCSITSLIAVTILFSSCGVNQRLDQNAEEIHAMNKNMADLNKTLAQGMSSFKTLSDESVSFMKKTDPQQFFDLFVQLSDKFEETVAGLLDQTGDVKEFVQQGNEAMKLFLQMARQIKPEDLENLGTTFSEVSANMKKFNDFLSNNTNDVKVLSNQMLLSTQMFVLFGNGLKFIDDNDAESMMASIDANRKSLGLATSASGLADKTYTLSTDLLKKNKNNQMSQFTAQLQTLSNFTKDLKKPLNELAGLKGQLDKMWDVNGKNSNSLNGMLKDIDTRYTKTFCLLLQIISAYATKPSPKVSMPMLDDQKLMPELTPAEIQNIKSKYNELCTGK